MKKAAMILILMTALVGCGRNGRAFMEGMNDGLQQQSNPNYYYQKESLRQQQIQNQQQQYYYQQLLNQQRRPVTCYSSGYGYGRTTTCY